MSENLKGDAAKHVPNTIKDIEKAWSNLKDAYGAPRISSLAATGHTASELWISRSGLDNVTIVTGDDRDVFDGQLQIQDDDVANLFLWWLKRTYCRSY